MGTVGSPCWYTIPCLSLPRAELFYASIFSWTFTPPPSDAIEPPRTASSYRNFNFMAPTHSVTGCLIQTDKIDAYESEPDAYRRVNWFFYVEDVEEMEERIRNAGGEVVKGKHRQGGMGWQSFFRDTEGNVFGIWAHNCAPGCPCKEQGEEKKEVR